MDELDKKVDEIMEDITQYFSTIEEFKMKVYRYETPNEVVTNASGPTIFLAGPTVRGNQGHLVSWRFEAIEIFEKLGFKGTLIVPEFTDKTESDKGRIELPIWEDNGLDRADCILFWLPRTRELIGLNTNSEHGYWLAKDPEKLVYGRPDDGFRIQYNDVMWDKVFKAEFNRVEPIYNTLEDTIKASMDVALKIALRRNKRGDEKDEYTISSNRLIDMAGEVRKMENACDWSMRGVYLEELVTNYVETFSDEFVMMFNYIYEHQEDDYDSYGDIDTSVTKLKLTGDIAKKSDWNDKYNWSARAIYLKDIFCDEKFVIVEVIKAHIDYPTISTTYYHVRTTDKDIKSIMIKDYTSKNFDKIVFDIKKDQFYEHFELDNSSRHMLNHYKKFKALFDAIRQPYQELKMDIEKIDIDEKI